ncbi:nitroreductase family deazaflavin-dependent oxidoreductase [Gordonia humi]|uniref:nitroreductase family deazaflavin-dependent oxidoreductase n=1 Tax=Gordonia humi TaxID=686429 RepID=UPI00161C8F57
MRVPRFVARANKFVTNPIQGLWAGRIAPWAVVEHIGRVSDNRYETPVLAYVDDGRLSIALNYGADADWVRNVLAAGRFTLVRRGRRLDVAGLRVIPSDSPDVVRSARFSAKVADQVLYGRVVSAA